ncbi:Sulfite exporter TauE/SafE [Candidatus Methylomirabilis lanthanidiphila]|uniref:Probable membrane transporter protein n=1 Tax=Candidatus Methylomirabilis lanthanidiphila TaxID=2211376 RepID=A0A564ZJZ3_9BACT|nr:sulfite exporter TauE/SafE family protein [Candidatus Methylomirabilis lanthanidiphila]VUZ85660.1 Sulfite exporter TauE/SafE [Candidatus Methylomirabilis lanthanidiphila]
MSIDAGQITLIGITLFAATVNGALGYGFSSLTVPVALIFYSNRILNPALVLVEVALNSYVLVVNRNSIPKVWKRVLPIVCGLIPGIIGGSYVLSTASPEWIKLITYLVVLPLILLQAAGVRRPIRSERLIGVPFGAGVGICYSVTTISGPPLALLFNNQGFVKGEFRAALGLIRVVESTVTATAYYLLGVYSTAGTGLLPTIVPSVAIGIPIGAYIIRRMNAETFRRICMSFDAWVVGFGLSKVLIDLRLMTSPTGYVVWLTVILIDLTLLYGFFMRGSEFATVASDVNVPEGSPGLLPQKAPTVTPDDLST